MCPALLAPTCSPTQCSSGCTSIEPYASITGDDCRTDDGKLLHPDFAPCVIHSDFSAENRRFEDHTYENKELCSTQASISWLSERNNLDFCRFWLAILVVFSHSF